MPAFPLIELDNVYVQRGARNLLDGISLTIREGQHTAILGPNGSGKSTLVRLISRQLYALGGRGVRIFGEERWNIAELQKQLGIVSTTLQLDFADHPPLEVYDAVVSGFFAARGIAHHHHVTAQMRERAMESIEKMGVSHLLGRSVVNLSTGEARRVLIARALVHQPRALLLDEPCAGLDPATRRQFLESLRILAREGTTLILVTHHIEEILPEIDHIVMLRTGRLMAEGAKADMLTDERLSDLFAMPVEVVRRGEWHGLSVA